MRISTAGNSHGEKLIGILEGMPSNVSIDYKIIEDNLKRRRKVYGRSQRQEDEKDSFKVVSGIRDGKTNGNPIGIEIPNKVRDVSVPLPTIPRPGHADLAGAIKYRLDSTRDVIERASARETAISVALESIGRQILVPLNIEVFAFSSRVGQVSSEDYYSAEEINLDYIYKSPLRALNKEIEQKMLEEIQKAKSRGDSLGGQVQVIVKRLPIGLGNHALGHQKLDSIIAARLFSVQSVKGVSFGRNLFKENLYGQNYQDSPYYKNEGIYHYSNNAGGIEGGMTNGEELIIDVALKPIPTMTKALESFDIKSKEKTLSIYERSDICQVPSAATILENAVAFVIAREIKNKYAGDSLEDILFNYNKERYL